MFKYLKKPRKTKYFGTFQGVFTPTVLTILGVIMFLRFGYAVGNLGLTGAVIMVVLGHLVTIPTALALSEIATNRRVEGGGEYFIVSRSFGLRIGTAIGTALYLSQAALFPGFSTRTVSYTSEGVTMVGTLYIPQRLDPAPAMTLVPGSAPMFPPPLTPAVDEMLPSVICEMICSIGPPGANCTRMKMMRIKPNSVGKSRPRRFRM